MSQRRIEPNDRSIMNTIKFECPYCHEINTGDESLYGQRVECRKCQATILVPATPATAEPQTARLIKEPGVGTRVPVEAADQETDIFNLSPAARAFIGRFLLTAICVVLSIGMAFLAHDSSWPPWLAFVPLVLGALLLMQVWIRVKSCSYRLTTQRLFVNRGWLTRHVDEMELYRVKDVVVDQGVLQRLLGYGTVTVLADDDTTPRLDLVSISSPIKTKEMIRIQYRAARRREGVRPTEFLQSP
jgi:membrane protein YdbS with pleckstrin-like domain